MKLNLNTDFTKFPRAVSVLAAGEAGAAPAFAKAVLAHDERHLRRRAVELSDGSKVLVDLPEPVALNDGDRLVLEDGRHVEIIAAPEEVYDIRARDGVHLTELAWHIGNRHLAAGIEADRIVILRDHVIKAMLEGLGATVREVSEPFKPVRGAYSGGHDHGHAHAHSHAEAHSHAHGESHSHSHSHSHDDHHHHDHD
ncbi:MULTISPECIES: urease accessory protein UreE [Mesorhizobium]|uniref:Urease accessory protein UreE n=4 Tax=Mesorhizobium TaxID=68287 RepID=A0A1A5ITP6_RHILI|nr:MULTISPECIES: urease accessory protein UreE [Mesorhizobium]MBE1707645.1 urease accessory protein UreE [Mesorhizobium japonicum]MBE1712769.1 urease accessory protein UreE [Mesorhizobium japonicum]MUT24895.1 urease accessory protein UreE [Mesorhizobium japonicum]MUT31438.1 urease accessory protein UreE [Mesorhizobium japonicum]OBP78989.1 urease accessory protein UreE [Mesorhizobium loti]